MRRLLTRFGPALLVLGGAVLVTAAPLQEAVGQWRQHISAVEDDRTTLAYRNALVGAYEAWEDAIVSFEVGGLSDMSARARAPALPAPGGAGASCTPLRGARIRIPSIGLDQAVVEGVARGDLRAGPGHFPCTALPGGSGNVVISGHRTTYTHPFFDLDRLEPGSLIYLDTPERTFFYAMERTIVVSPTDVSPLADADYPKLTLTTCHPKGSARQRLVVEGRLLAG